MANSKSSRFSAAFFVLVFVLLNLISAADNLVGKSGADAVLELWASKVYLKFCPTQASAYVYFTPPNVPWHEIRVQLLSSNLFDSGPGPQFLNMNQVKMMVNSNTGLAKINFTDAGEFTCSLKCQGFFAMVQVISYSNGKYCKRCRMSSTPKDCLYYANGSVLPDSTKCRQASSPPGSDEQSLLAMACSSSQGSMDSGLLIGILSCVLIVLLLITLILLVLFVCWKKTYHQDSKTIGLHVSAYWDSGDALNNLLGRVLPLRNKAQLEATDLIERNASGGPAESMQ